VSLPLPPRPVTYGGREVNGGFCSIDCCNHRFREGTADVIWGLGVGSGEDCGGPNGWLRLGWGARSEVLGSYAASEIQAGTVHPPLQALSTEMQAATSGLAQHIEIMLSNSKVKE